jgi:hypothetical protein
VRHTASYLCRVNKQSSPLTATLKYCQNALITTPLCTNNKTSLMDERRRYKTERRKVTIVAITMTNQWNHRAFWSYNFGGNIAVLGIYRQDNTISRRLISYDMILRILYCDNIVRQSYWVISYCLYCCQH